MKALTGYQVKLLGEQRHIRCEQLAQGCCPINAAVGVKPATSWSRVQRPATTPPSHRCLVYYRPRSEAGLILIGPTVIFLQISEYHINCNAVSTECLQIGTQLQWANQMILYLPTTVQYIVLYSTIDEDRRKQTSEITNCIPPVCLQECR